MKNLKLSPNMQAAMWAQDRFERGLNAQRPTMRTVQALVARGLVEKTGRWVSLSKLGKEWLADHIETAHAVALDENIERYPASKFPYGVWEQAWRMKARAGLYTWPKGMVALDERDAHEMDRRLDEADIIAARLGFDAHSEALIEYATHPTSDAATAARMLARAGLMEYPASLQRDDLADAAMTNYQRLIGATLGTTNLAVIALVEEFMRDGRSGLDGLTAAEFKAMALAAHEDVHALAEIGELEFVCQGYGVAVPILTNA